MRSWICELLYHILMSMVNEETDLGAVLPYSEEFGNRGAGFVSCFAIF